MLWWRPWQLIVLGHPLSSYLHCALPARRKEGWFWFCLHIQATAEAPAVSWLGGSRRTGWRAVSCSLRQGGQCLCCPCPCCTLVPRHSGGTFTPGGLRELITQVHWRERKGRENRGYHTLCYLAFFSLWFGTFVTQGTDSKRARIQEREAEFKKAEENLNRVVQRETPRVIFKCRINNEVLYIHVRMYNKKGKNKCLHMKMRNTPNKGVQHKRRPR